MLDQIVLQNVIAYAVVFFAAFWIARRVFRTIRAGLSAGEGSHPTSCAGCTRSKSAAAAPRIKPLVQIGIQAQPSTDPKNQ